LIHSGKNAVDFAVRFVGASAVVSFAYYPLMKFANSVTRKFLLVFPPDRISFLESQRIVILPAWGLAVAILYVAISPILHTSLFELFVRNFRIEMLAIGILLGIGEGAVSLVLASFAFRVMAPRRHSPIDKREEMSLELSLVGKAGWMRTFADAFRIVPIPWSLVLVFVALTGEELIFRAIVIPLFLPYSVAVAIGISTLLFITVQLSHLPSWYQGVAPACGAVVMGLANGGVFVIWRNLTPLAIAHVVYLAFLIGPAALVPKVGEHSHW
jgi:membrane protease YdiL (CAAX protease family)